MSFGPGELELGVVYEIFMILPTTVATGDEVGIFFFELNEPGL